MIASLISILIVLIVLSAAFSASETVLFSLTPLQINRIGERNAETGRKISSWLEAPAGVLATILAGNTFVNFAIAALGYRLFLLIAPERAAAYSITVFTFVLLLFGEIIPKQLAIRKAESLAPVCAGLLSFAMPFLKPVSAIMLLSTKVFKNLLTRERRTLSDDELRTVMGAAAASGVIGQESVSMTDGILRLSDLAASDEMTPRVDMLGIEESASDAEKHSIITNSPYPFIPVYRKTPDAITALLDVKKYLLDPEHSLEDASQEPLFVPENARLDDLLEIFTRSGRHIAVVADEYGGTAGLITRGDIVELIAEPVSEAGDPDFPESIRETAPGEWLCSGLVSLEELNRELDLDLEADDADRLSGWMMFHAGRLPHVGQVVSAQGIEAFVESRRNRRILTVRIKKTAPAEDAEAAAEAVEDAVIDEPVEGDAAEANGDE